MSPPRTPAPSRHDMPGGTQVTNTIADLAKTMCCERRELLGELGARMENTESKHNDIE